MCRCCKDPHCPGVAAAACRALQRGSSADQIIQDNDGAVTHVTDQEVTGDDAAAAPLFDECCRRLVMKFCRERPAELLGALGAANVRRDNGKLFVPQESCEVLDKERHRLEIG